MTGDEYFDSEDFKELLATYEEGVQQGELPFMDADDLTDIADYYLFTGQPEAAGEATEHALNLYPDATAPNLFVARQALLNEEFDTAQQYLDRIEDNDDPDCQYMQAELLVAQNQVEEADRYLHDILDDIDPDDYQDFVLDAANIFLDYGFNDKAYEWMMRSKGDDSDDFKELMGRALFGLGKYKDSERIFNELIDRHPYSKNYWNALANAQMMNRDYSNAVTSSEYAIAIDPKDPEGLICKANGLYQMENYEEALTYFQRYSELVPDDEFAQLYQGACYYNMNQPQNTVKVLEKTIRSCPPDSPYLAQIYEELAFSYSALHLPDKAVRCIEKTESLDCDHAELAVVQGHILLENGRAQHSDKYFRKALRLAKDTPHIMVRIIVSLYDNGYVEACHDIFEKLFGIAGDQLKEGYSYMALCCRELGRNDDFLHYLKKAVEVNPAEAASVLRHIFPPEVEVNDYYNYMADRIRNS